MVGWDPAFVISFGARGNRRSISTNNRNLISRVDFLRLARGALSPLATFTTTALLGEKRGNPGAVDEIAGSEEGGQEEEVQEYAGETWH